MSAGAGNRLSHVLDIDDSVANFNASAAAAQLQRDAISKADLEEGRALERACLKAEREGPAGWAQVLPRLTAHLVARPEDAQAWSYMARARVGKGEDSEALRAAREAMRLDPNIVFGHSLSLLVARSSAESKRWDHVAQHANAALASQPGDGEALGLLVQALAAQGFTDRAEATLGVLAQVSGDSKAAAIAKQLASEHGQSPKDRYRWLSQAVALGRGAERPFQELGEICLVLRREEEASKWFQQVSQQPGGDADPEVAQSLARLHIQAGKIEEAMKVYQSALAATPDNLSIRRNYCKVLLQQGLSADAIQEMQHCARLASAAEAARLYMKAAELQQSLGQTEEARQSWEAAVESDPKNPDCLVKFASLQLNGGNAGSQQLQEARSYLERALQLRPGHPEALLKLGELKQGKEKLELLERAARADPNSVEAIQSAAAMRWSLEDYADASVWYKSLIGLQPRHSTALSRLACIALFERKVCEAEALMVRALGSDQPSQEALALMGYVQVLLGKGEKAVSYLKKAMSYPQHEVHLETRLYWALALLEQNDAAAAADAFDAAAKMPGQVQEALADAVKREALLQGRLGDAGLAKSLLPGASPQVSRQLASLVRKCPEASTLKGSGSARIPASSPGAPNTAAQVDPAKWREAMREGQPLEVYSKSAGVWLSGKLTQVNADMVKVAYNIDGQLCEKVLLRSSESLRQVPDSMSHARPAPGQSNTVPEKRPATSASTGKAEVAAAKPSASPPQSKTVQPATAAAAALATPSPRQGGPYSAGRSGGAPPPAPSTKGIVPTESSSSSIMLNSKELEMGKVLGSGGFGAVYRGRYRGQEVAIKKLHITDGQVSTEQIDEFRKEVSNLQALRHPRLISFLGAALSDAGGGSGPPSLCIVTEFMPNGSLHALLHQSREPLKYDQRLSMAIQVSEGVVFLHSLSPPFVHRDLKSLNAVLDFELNVKLCDFGLTQSMEKTHISRRDNEGGSPRYMAPELFDSRGKITEKVDVWALGCMAIEILTGRLPHEECSSIQQVMTKTLIDKDQPFLNWEGVSKDLRALAELAFEFRPAVRIDAVRFLEGLRAL